MTPVTEDRIRQIYDDFANGRLDRLAEALASTFISSAMRQQTISPTSVDAEGAQKS